MHRILPPTPPANGAQVFPRKNRPIIDCYHGLPDPVAGQLLPLILPYDPRRLTPGTEVVLCRLAKPLGFARLLCADAPVLFDALADSAFLWIRAYSQGRERRASIRQHFDALTDLQTRLFAVYVFEPLATVSD